MPDPPVRLVPAQPHPEDESEDYMRRIPWRWIIFTSLALIIFVSGYWYKEKQKADALRAQILQVHEQELKEVSEQYQHLRNKIENWIIKATASKPKNYIDPRLNIAGLRAGQGLYLRLRISQAIVKSKIAQGILNTSPDAILNCLGLEAAQVRNLYDKGQFLLPEWVDEVRTSTDVMRLRVIDDELARRISRDLPEVTGLLRSDWFLLVIQQGKTRDEDPVDVFLWDIRSGKKLLSSRIQAKGLLVPVQYLSKGIKPATKLSPDALKGIGANDCSIAAQIKAIAGSPVTTFSSDIPTTGSPEKAVGQQQSEHKQVTETNDSAEKNEAPSPEQQTPQE